MSVPARQLPALRHHRAHPRHHFLGEAAPPPPHSRQWPGQCREGRPRQARDRHPLRQAGHAAAAGHLRQAAAAEHAHHPAAAALAQVERLQRVGDRHALAAHAVQRRQDHVLEDRLGRVLDDLLDHQQQHRRDRCARRRREHECAGEGDGDDAGGLALHVGLPDARCSSGRGAARVSRIRLTGLRSRKEARNSSGRRAAAASIQLDRGIEDLARRGRVDAAVERGKPDLADVQAVGRVLGPQAQRLQGMRRRHCRAGRSPWPHAPPRRERRCARPSCAAGPTRARPPSRPRTRPRAPAARRRAARPAPGRRSASSR